MNRFTDWLLSPILSSERSRWYRYGSKAATDHALSLIDSELRAIEKILLNPKTVDQQAYLKKLTIELNILRQRVSKF
jgi:hypothetical protein